MFKSVDLRGGEKRCFQYAPMHAIASGRDSRASPGPEGTGESLAYACQTAQRLYLFRFLFLSTKPAMESGTSAAVEIGAAGSNAPGAGISSFTASGTPI